MTTDEMIYEGIGEVTAVENKIVVTTGTDTERLQFFSQEMTDEAVAGWIFDSCDTRQNGKVHVSILLDFLLKSCGGDSEESRELFNKLLIMLDPQQVDPLISAEVFQDGLKTWIAQVVAVTEETDTVINTIRFSKIESEQSDSGNSLCTSQPSSESSGELLIDELQYQHTKLQELHKNLQTQLVDVDEINMRLQSENANLRNRILYIETELKEKTEELKQLQDDNSFLHNDLRDRTEDFQNLMLRYQNCERELTYQNSEREAMQLLCGAEKEKIKQLEASIQHLEELIRTKEIELEDKDKELHLLTLQLTERQSTLDQSLASAERRLSLAPSILETPSLASDLNCASPFNTLSWKKPKDRIKQQDYILPWNAMFHEPEFEEELSNDTISFSRGPTPTVPSGLQNARDDSLMADSHSSSASGSPVSVCPGNLISTPKTGREHINLHLSGDSSRIVENPPVFSLIDEPIVSTAKTTPLYFQVAKNLSMSVFYLCFILFAATLTLVWALLLLSMIDTGDCSLHGGHQCSPWNKMVTFLKPYCHMEHFGPPPV